MVISDEGGEDRAIALRDGPLEGSRARQPLSAFLRDHQLALVSRKRCPQVRLKTFVNPVLLASLDNGREAEKACEERYDRKKHEVDDESAREAGQDRRPPSIEV